MNQISKPHIVDLIRIFDKNRYINPRIRYASVRSKPELLNDLRMHFRVSCRRKEKTFYSPGPGNGDSASPENFLFGSGEEVLF